MAWKNVTVLKLLFILLLASTKASKLNVARVLLPLFEEFSTNFTLQSPDESCFRWSTTKQDVITLTPVDYTEGLDCSPAVVVSTITKERTRIVSDVFAEDIVTRQTLRCVVIVDTVESLAITTKTRELILEEAPEVFEVRAYDNQGNEFSTLTGVPFEWIITPFGPHKDLPVFRFISFKESPYETPETLLDLEERKKQGHKVLIEGVKTGMSKVTVRLAQKEYIRVRSNEIQLSVVANLLILPPEVYILEGDVVTFKIIHTSYGHAEELSLENSQYYFDVENKAIAHSKKYNSDVIGVNEGDTKIVLHDRNMDEKDPGLKFPTAIIHVVKPAYMVLTLLPHKNWAALVSEVHDIVAEVYSAADRKITLGRDLQVHTQVGDAYHVQERSKNGTWQTGWTQREGVAEVSAVLESISNKKLNPPLTATNEIVIYPRIVLIPSEVILPWDPVAKPKYDFEVQATGGDGKFLWSSSNHSIGVVTQYGKVHTHSFGFFEISAAMHRNHHNRQTAKVHILPPSRLEIIEFVMEAEVGSIIYLHVALYAEKKGKDGEPVSHIPFTKCQELPFKVKLSDPKFNHNKKMVAPPVGISCGNVAIFSSEIGTSKVSVSYHGENGRLLSDMVTVTYFKPLKLLKPTGTVVLAVGTSTNLIFTGGPKSVLGNTHNKYVISRKPETVRAIDDTMKHKMPIDEEYTVVNVVCAKLGKGEVILSASNPPNIPNCKNQESQTSVQVICGKPRRIEMYPEIKVADAKSCPMDLSAERVVVQSNKDIDLIVVVRDDQGREFMNITSLKLNWELKPLGLGLIGHPNCIYQKNSSVGTASYYNKSFQRITPKVETGFLSVSAQIAGYRKQIPTANKVTPEWPEFLDEDEKGVELPPINATISLYLVDDTVVTPNIVSIYNHPANRHLLDVKQGSGFYSMALSRSDLADVKYIEKSRQLNIQPLADGELTVKLIDLCLVSKPAIIVITVVSVHILRVEMSDKVEITKCISCIVRMYDELDNLLTIPNLDLIELNSNFEHQIARINKERPSSNPSEIHFVITGLELGDTKLIFSIGEPETDGYVGSAPMELQVFPPLKLYPRNVTLAVGSQMQYHIRGGPQPTPNLEYSILSVNTGKISSHGIVKGLAVGHTKVKARALGTNPTTGQKIVYTEDTVDVCVIKLTSIKLAAPLTRFQVGSTVPIWATGIPDQISPLVLATIEPSMEFSWGVQDSSIVKLTGLLDSIGIERNLEDMLSIRLTALSPGTTTVYLNATVMKNNGKKGPTFASSVDVEVFEKLRLIGPVNTDGQPLLLAPFSFLKLETNMDSMGDMSYRLLGDGVQSGTHVQKKVLTTPNQPVTISSTGVIQSYGILGYTMILVTCTDVSGLRQALTIPIEIKPIHYMMLTFSSKWTVDPPHATTAIPVGTEFDMQASYYDNVGNQFAGGTVELQVLTSRFDLLQIRRGADNSSFHVCAKRPGITAVKVWSDSIEKTADYVKLHFKQVIAPSVEHITASDVMCFKTPVIKTSTSGIWTVGDDSVISIEENTGLAVAVGLKGGHTAIMHSFHPAAPLQIRVNPISEIIIDHPTEKLTNSPESLYKLHFLAKSVNSVAATNMFAGWDCANQMYELDVQSPFDCQLSFDNKALTVSAYEVFSVASKFDANEGKYYCEIVSTRDSNLKYNMLSSNVLLTVSEQLVQSKPMKLKFVPAIYVPKEVLVDDTFTGSLVINGHPSVLNNVETKEIDNSIVCITSRKVENSSLVVKIQLLDYHKNLEEMKDFMSISVDCDETRQHYLVLVKAKHPEKLIKECHTETSLFSMLHANRHLFALLLAILLIMIATFYIYSSYVQPTINVSVLAANRTCPPQTMGSPNRGCGSPNCPNTQSNFMCKTSNYSCQPSNTSSNLSRLDSSCCYCTRSPEARRSRRYL